MINPRFRDEIITACCVISEQENLRVSLTSCAQGALLTGLGVFLGGLLAGRVGMAVGGTVGSLGVAMNSKGKVKSVLTIIQEMTPDQKRRLSTAIQNALRQFPVHETIELFTVATLTSVSWKGVILEQLGSFLYQEFGMTMIR